MVRAMAKRVLIVDDDPGITSALARGLSLHGYEAQTENRADRALERLRAESFGGAIVDVMLGADSGIDLVRDLRGSGVTIPILMLSALSEVEHRAAGLEAGADDYVVKPFSLEELAARLAVQEHRSRTQVPQASRFTRADRNLTRGDLRITLTEREAELLCLLAANGTAPLPRGEIFDRLWARDGSGAENVVDVYIGYLRRKLATGDFGFEIRTRRNRGFFLDGTAPSIG